MKVKNKVFVVTGGGNGVGREITLQLLRQGAHVAAMDINMEGLEETKKLSNASKYLSIHKVDITNLESIQVVYDEIIKTHAAVDGIINNAGIIQPFIHVKDLDMKTVDRVMNVNFYGTYYMISTFLPHLLTRPEAHILNVSSMGGFLPVPGQALYGASKAAVRQLTTSLYTELKDTNVNVSVVIPGAMATNIKKNSQASDREITQKDKNNKMLLSPEKAAVLIIDTIEKNKLVKYLGKDSAIMNLMMKIAPRLSMNLVTSMMSTAH